MEADPATGNNKDQGKCLGTKLGALHSGHKVGYARASTGEQNLDRQVAQLKAEKVFTYFTDKRSGRSRERPGLDEAMRYVRSGDQ